MFSLKRCFNYESWGSFSPLWKEQMYQPFIHFLLANNISKFTVLIHSQRSVDLSNNEEFTLSFSTPPVTSSPPPHSAPPPVDTTHSRLKHPESRGRYVRVAGWWRNVKKIHFLNPFWLGKLCGFLYFRYTDGLWEMYSERNQTLGNHRGYERGHWADIWGERRGENCGKLELVYNKDTSIIPSLNERSYIWGRHVSTKRQPG